MSKVLSLGRLPVSISNTGTKGKIERNRLGGAKVKFEIVDSGIGMSELALSKVFRSFSQADSSTSRRFGGTGLGLAICKHLVTLMGGEIGVSSKENAGSTFWFQIELKTGETPSVQETKIDYPPLKAVGHSKGHILVVDDNKVNQSVLGLNLENLSYSLEVASDGFEAIQKATRFKYDLIFMDCQMPGMDGYEATQTLRRHQDIEISSLPIIALTANAISGDRDKCIEAGMNDYMTKPIKADLLEIILSKWISSSKGVFVDKNSEPVLDLSVFEELKRLQKPGRPDIVAGLIALYLETATEIADKVVQSISNKDLEGLANAAHSLKSSSANVGATRLSKLCFELEKIGEGKALAADLAPFLETFNREYGNAIYELKSLSKVS